MILLARLDLPIWGRYCRCMNRRFGFLLVMYCVRGVVSVSRARAVVLRPG